MTLPQPDLHHGHGSSGEDVVTIAEKLIARQRQRFERMAVTSQLEDRRVLQLTLEQVRDVVDHQHGAEVELIQRRQQVAGGACQER